MAITHFKCKDRKGNHLSFILWGESQDEGFTIYKTAPTLGAKQRMILHLEKDATAALAEFFGGK